MPRRAALLPSFGDPFVLAYWLRNYDRVWEDEVDDLLVYVNGCPQGEVLDYCWRAVTDAGGRLLYQEGRLTHGEALECLLGATLSDEVMLIEDDAYVRFPGEVSRHFDLLGKGVDVVGSPRGGMSPEVERAAIERWGAPPEGPDGSSGYGLWPCFLFARTDVLRDVAPGMQSLVWQAGETIPGVGYTCPSTMTTDTATLAAFLLRERFPDTIAYEGQWKELWMKRLFEMEMKAGYDPPWFHAGGLSNELFFLDQGALGSRPDIGGTNEGLDWASRVWWWRECLETSVHLPELGARYQERLARAVNEMGIHAEVKSWDSLAEWIAWDAVA